MRRRRPDVVTVNRRVEIPSAIAIAFDAAEKSGAPYDAAVALAAMGARETFHFEIVSMESLARADDLSIHAAIRSQRILTVETTTAWRGPPG